MGVHGLDNQPASQYAQKVCLEHGVDISSHRSRQLVYDEMQSAHIVFALERVHKEFIATFFPRFNEKVFLLGAWPDAETKKSNVDDPMGGTLKAYEKCYSIIAHHVDRIIPFLPDIYP
jgi:protein-tyrosine phosphatase